MQHIPSGVRTHSNAAGFFYVTNFGLSKAAISQQFPIGRDLFQLPVDEKLKYRAYLEQGSYSGYRPLGSIEVLPGVHHNVEMYNVHKFLPKLERRHPHVVEE